MVENQLLQLSPSAVRRASWLMWLAIAACIIHLGAAFLIDPGDFLARGHASPSGIGVIIDDFAPLAVSSELVVTLGLIDFCFTALIYVGVAVFARALKGGLAFDQRVLDAARFFAWTVVAVAIQEIAFNTLASVIRTPEDSGRTAYFMVSSPQLVSLFLGGTLLVFASIFAKAKFVAEDSASIV